MRTAAFDLEDRRVGCRFLINLAGMLRDQLTHHLEVAELLDGNIL